MTLRSTVSARMLGHASVTTPGVYGKIVDKIAENPGRYLEELMELSRMKRAIAVASRLADKPPALKQVQLARTLVGFIRLLDGDLAHDSLLWEQPVFSPGIVCRQPLPSGRRACLRSVPPPAVPSALDTRHRSH
jgi:hypothetical protein